MRCLAFFVAALSPALQTDQDSGPPTARAQFEALIKQYDRPLGTYLNDQAKAKTATEPFIRLARQYSNNAVALDALHWVVTHTLFTPMAGEAMDLLSNDHVNDSRIKPTIKRLDQLYGQNFEPFERLLRTAASKSPQPEVRGWASLALGRYLAKWKKRVEWERFQHAIFLEEKNVPFVAKPEQTDNDLQRMAREAEALFGSVISEYGGIDNLAQAAKADLFELQHLAVGTLAPEIEGRDVDGKPFKLSDYRGNVVILDFWNHTGCGPCRAMYPELRSLVDSMKGKRFVVLGVNNDDEPQTLRNLADRGEVTWRFWCDGNSNEGPIRRKWNVSVWPAVFVLDDRGAIRYRQLLGADLEAAVDQLLKEQPDDGAK
jgi:peroxiredoxin